MIELGNVVHGYPRSGTKERLLEFYTSLLGLKASTAPPPYWTGSPDQFFGFQFSNGKVLSGEFTDDGLDDQRAQKPCGLNCGQMTWRGCNRECKLLDSSESFTLTRRSFISRRQVDRCSGSCPPGPQTRAVPTFPKARDRRRSSMGDGQIDLRRTRVSLYYLTA